MSIDIHNNGTAQHYLDWLNYGLAQPGKTVRGLGRHLNLAGTQVSKMRHGQRRIHAGELGPIAEYLEMPVPNYNGTGRRPVQKFVTVIGDSGGKAWYGSKSKPTRQDILIPLMPHSKYAGLPQFAVKMVDHAMDTVVPFGDFAIYVPYWSARKLIVPGDIVVVYQRKRGLFLPLVRLISKTNSGFELICAPAERKADKGRMALTDAACIKGGKLAPDDVAIMGYVFWRWHGAAV